MGIGKREYHEEADKNKYLKIIGIILLIVLVCITIYVLVEAFVNKDNSITNTNENNSKSVSEENDIDEKLKNEKENEKKSLDEIIQKGGYTLKEKASEDIAYVEKDGKEFTVYSNGDVWTERIIPWNGQEAKPAIDEAGNINIYNAEELKWVANQVISGAKNFSGVTITLRKDLDLGARKTKDGSWEGNKWTSIIGFLDEIPAKEGTPAPQIDESQVPQDGSVNIKKENLKRFAGVFNGNGFSIRGMYVDEGKRYQGLVGYNDGIISNLTISNSCIKGDTGVGAIAGLNSGIIQNCNIRDVEVSGKNKIGGIVGISMENSTLESDSVSDTRGIITGENYVGGIAGYLNNNNIVKNAINRANVQGKNYVGGISGIAFFGTSIENSSNYAKLVIGEEYVGGLVGYSAAQINHSNNFDSSVKKGAVQGNNFVGGLVGLNYKMGNIASSYTLGNVNCKNDNCGGIVGLNNGNIANTYNAGNITIENSKALKVGGICGQNLSESFIYTSYNVGTVNNDNIDGIIGANFGEVDNCFILDTSLKINEENKEIIKSQDDMKENILPNLGPEFKKDEENINEGYPILNWQTKIG